jgi:hypothetical protein
MITGTEISPEVAKRLWLTHSIFAYDEDHQVEWQINGKKKTCICDLNEAIKNNNILFVENN